jgi:Integrase core domain
VLRRPIEPGQYTSIRFSERLAEAGIQPSVGAVGSSYDNALAETINGLYKTELIKPRKPWKTIEEVELVTAEWVHWFNHRHRYSILRRHPAGRRGGLLRSPPETSRRLSPHTRKSPDSPGRFTSSSATEFENLRATGTHNWNPARPQVSPPRAATQFENLTAATFFVVDRRRRRAARSAEADVQRGQAEDLPAAGLRGDNDDPGAGCRV